MGQRTWTMQGAYATWAVTLTAEAVDGEDPIDVPVDVMASIKDCFDAAVNRYELTRDVDRLDRRLS